jgi:hypothetical protein
MATVTFDPVAFVAEYPEFTSVTNTRMQSMFTIAEQSILDNTDNSPVMDINYRTQLFYMLVAHLLLIFGTPTAPANANNAPPGRLSSATEGSVSTAFEYILPAGSAMAPWFVQTKYGAMYWTLTARFRSAVYFAAGNSGVGYSQAFNGTPFDIPGGV